MGLFTWLFGQKVVVRFEGETVDGETFSGKAPFEGYGFTEENILNHLKNYIEVEKNVRVKSLRIVGSYNQ